MSEQDIIRSWKDPEYRDSLSAEEAGSVPQHPSGLVELSDADLGVVAGGRGISWSADTTNCWSLAKCPSMGGTCAMFTLGCCAVALEHALEDITIFGGVGAINSDGTLADDEIDLMRQSIAEWQVDPRLSGEQLDNISRVTESLRGQVSAEEWQVLENNLRDLRESGRISDGQLAELTEYVDVVSR